MKTNLPFTNTGISVKLLIILLLLCFPTAYSQILLEEDFEASTIPTGWFEGLWDGDGTQPWTFGSGVMPGNENYNVSDFYSNAAIFDDNAAGGGHHDARGIVSPFIDGSSTYGLILRFDYMLNNKGAGGDNEFGDHLHVFALDQNYHSVQLADYSQTTDYIVSEELDLASLLNGSVVDITNFQIAWVFDDVDSSWGWGCGIDNVKVIIPPENDAYDHAIEITPNELPYVHTQSMDGTTNNTGNINICDGMNDGVWYTFTPDISTVYQITAYATEYDGEIGIYSFDGSNFECVGYDDTNGDTDSFIGTLLAGTQYWINIGDYGSITDTQESGDMTISLSEYYPPNDLCDYADELIVGDYFFEHNLVVNNMNASHTAGVDPDCISGDQPEIWFWLEVPESGRLVIETRGTGSVFDDSVIAVFGGSCGDFTEIACNDDNPDIVTLFSKVELNEPPGEILYVTAYSFPGAPSGEFQIAAYTIPPPNDNCSDAIPLTVGASFEEQAIVADNWYATHTYGIDACAGSDQPEVWFEVVVPASGQLTIETRPEPGSDFNDSIMAAYFACDDSSTEIACNDDKSATDTFSKIEITPGDVTAGTSLFIPVYSFPNTPMGQFQIAAYDTTLRLDDIEHNLNFEIYPNPAQDSFSLKLPEKVDKVSIIDSLGREVAHYTSQDSYDVSQLSKGIYWVRVMTNSGNGVKKLLIE